MIAGGHADVQAATLGPGGETTFVVTISGARECAALSRELPHGARCRASRRHQELTANRTLER